MSTLTTKDVYTCDGVTFVFPITFEFDRAADVFVFLTDPDGTPRRMIPNQDYVVDGTTVVTRVDDHRDPIAAGIVLTIQLQMPFRQPSGRAGMSAKVFKVRVDSLTRMFRQLREQLERTLHVGEHYIAYALLSDVYPLNPIPTITSFDPASIDEDSTGVTLTVTGTNFIPTSVVRWEGVDLTTVYVSATELNATLLDADLVDPGTFDITVFNPAPVGGESEAMAYTVNDVITYATWDNATHGADITLSGGNLVATRGAAANAWRSVRSTVGKSSGKWYFELVITGLDPSGNNSYVDGVADTNLPQTSYVGSTTSSLGIQGRPLAGPSDDLAYYNGSSVGGGAPAIGLGDVLGVAMNMDLGEIRFYRNNTLLYYHDLLAGTQYAAASLFTSTAAVTANFGATSFVYSPPAGYNAGLYEL